MEGSGWRRREGRVKGRVSERGWKGELQMSFCSHAFCFKCLGMMLWPLLN